MWNFNFFGLRKVINSPNKATEMGGKNASSLFKLRVLDLVEDKGIHES